MWDWKVNKSCGSLKCAAENEFKEKWILGNGCHNHSAFLKRSFTNDSQINHQSSR